MAARRGTKNTTKTSPKTPVLNSNEEGGYVSAVRLREIRRMVRNTASLMATDGPIYECPGSHWAADFRSRTIYWRATAPYPPFSVLTQDNLLFLTVHEAYHIKITGGWDCPKDFDPMRFHRFINACEDIRIERQATKDWPGFGPIRQDMAETSLNEWLKVAPVLDQFGRPIPGQKPRPFLEGCCFMDQVWINWHMMEHGMGNAGHPEAIKFATDSWDDISRICNAASTEKMAKMLEPYYRAMQAPPPPPEAEQGEKDEPYDPTMQLEPPVMPQPKSKGEGDEGETSDGSGESSLGQAGSEGTGDGEVYDDSDARDEPADRIERSEMPEHGKHDAGNENEKDSGKGKKNKNRQTTTTFSEEEQLEGMAKDAKDKGTKDAIRNKIAEEKAEQGKAAQIAQNDADTCNGNAAQDDGIDAPSKRNDWGKNANARPADINGEASWNQAKDRMRPHINALRRKLEVTLRNNAMDDWEPGLKRGQLDAGVAWRSLAGNNDIFRDRTEVGALDYSFGIIVDMSSSQAQRRKALLESAVLVAEALEGAGLKWFMLPWNEYPQRGKRFRDPLSRRKGSLGRHIGSPWGGTYEAPALIFAEDEFGRAPSHHKFMITLTDGQTRAPHESKSLVEDLEDQGVRCMGIGVQYKAPAHYPERMSVDDAAELVRILPLLIGQVVKKGRR
jgi:hypothetical protein